MLGAWLKGLVLVLAPALLAGCGVLPTSGPSAHAVHAPTSFGNIQIINVNDTVTRQLIASRSQKLFSEEFVDGQSNELVHPGDVLEVSVWEAPPGVLFSSPVKDSALTVGISTSSVTTLPAQMISSDGTIFVPFAGAIPAAGKRPKDIQELIEHHLEGKAHQPQVLVRLLANNTAYVTVVGDVTNSTRMPLTPRNERLLDALAAAAGTRQPIEKTTLQVTRGTSVHSLPLATVIRDPRQNIPMQSGDVVTALYQPLSFLALGATGKADEINFETQGISLAQALARAGGLVDARANAQGVFVFRFEAKDALSWPNSPLVTPEGTVPVIYCIDLKDPGAFFVAQTFPMGNKDVLYVANAPAAQLQKFLNLLLSTVYPIEGAINLTK
jgi:polysaccharide biosynthesis/export protein